MFRLHLHSVPAMEGPGRYQGVSKPGDGALGWVAQRKGCCYAARFRSEQQAAQWLARRLGVSVSSLRRKTRPVAADRDREAQVSYRGVVYHSGCWEARVAGVVLGYYGTQREAIKKVMKETRQTEKQLLRKKGFSRSTLQARFRCKHRIFGSYEPSDIRSMYEHESEHARIYRQDRFMKLSSACHGALSAARHVKRCCSALLAAGGSGMSQGTWGVHSGSRVGKACHKTHATGQLSAAVSLAGQRGVEHAFSQQGVKHVAGHIWQVASIC